MPTEPVARVADRRFPVTTEGRTVHMPLYATGDLLAGHPAVTRFVVMINGTLRNADAYFATTVDSARAAGVDPTEVLIAVPQFLATVDADAHTLDADTPYWTPEGWKIGDRTVRPARGPSSYAILDAIVTAALDRDRFPSLRTVVIAGHSAGGQYVHRYIPFNRVYAALRAAGIEARYVVANPSSYLYFDDRRVTAEGTLAPYPRASCSEFNRYRYGLEELNEYGRAALAASGGGAGLAREYGRRTVTYLLGAEDTDPHNASLDTSCGAGAQGATRFVRGQRYFQYVQLLLGPAVLRTQSLHVVPDVGHDGRGMFLSSAGRAALFDGRP
jgi:hypothetical protein